MISFREFLLLENKPKITINDDLTVDVEGDVDISSQNLKLIPVQFGKVGGDFYCVDNILTSLEGAPKEVSGVFSCRDNKLTSLAGAPKEVGGYFNCGYNQLTSLEGAPKKVGGNFYCSNNKLTSLEGAPKEVGDFYCSFNKLTSLKGAPKEVSGMFDCRGNTAEFTKDDVKKVSNVKGEIKV